MDPVDELQLDESGLRNEFTLELGWAISAGVSKRAIAREFGCSRPTLARWLDGRAFPHRAMLKPVIAGLRELRIKAKEQVGL